MGTRTFLCDLGWTIGKLELDNGDESPPELDQLILVQPGDDTTAATSLVIPSRENIIRLRDFIDEALREAPPQEPLPGD